MQQATYRSPGTGSMVTTVRLSSLEWVKRLTGELAALASLAITLIGGLLIAASYLV